MMSKYFLIFFFFLWGLFLNYDISTVVWPWHTWSILLIQKFQIHSLLKKCIKIIVCLNCIFHLFLKKNIKIIDPSANTVLCSLSNTVFTDEPEIRQGTLASDEALVRPGLFIWKAALQSPVYFIRPYPFCTHQKNRTNRNRTALEINSGWPYIIVRPCPVHLSTLPTSSASSFSLPVLEYSLLYCAL